MKRPDFYFGKDRPSELWLSVTPPPPLMQAFDGDIDALVHHMRRLAEEGIRALRDARKGRPPMGAAKLRQIHPWMEPRTLVERGGGLVPVFKVGARGLVGRRMSGQCAREVTGWRAGHEEARLERLAGEEPAFPYGTYGMRVFHNAPVEEKPPADAIVAAPGPLIEEVMAELAGREKADPSARRGVVDEVRDAWREEAAEVIEHAELDLDEATRPSPRAEKAGAEQPASGTETTSPERPEPEVRHRFDPDRDRHGRPHPRRLITKRDRRRRKLRKRGRSDPPR